MKLTMVRVRRGFVFSFFCESRYEIKQSRGSVNIHNNSSRATGYDKKIFPLDG